MRREQDFGNSRKKPLKHEEIINQAVQLALDYKKEHPLEIGDVVAHPSEDLAYEIRGIDEKATTATVFGYKDLKTKEIITRIFPLAEIFDVNVCDQFATSLRIRQVSRISRLN